MPSPLLEKVLATCIHMHVPVGTVLIDEDQPCNGFPLLLSGYIRVIKAAANGRELLLYRVGPGESCIFAIECLLGQTNYHARAVVDQDLDVVSLPPATFMTLYSEYVPFRDYIFSTFSTHLIDLTQLVSAVAFQKLDQRLASLLVRKSSPIRSTHQALADELGSVRVIVSRLLKNFADNGWLALGREQIEIIDATALKKYAEL